MYYISMFQLYLNGKNFKISFVENQRIPFKKQPFADVLQSRYYKKLRNIHRKTPALESLFNNVPVLQACKFIKK